MAPQVRYQVFVSSTFEDLREERQQATQAILEAGCFPSGMELFPASDDTQWELIKRVIEESDYYVVIVAGRYGSLGPEGISYTEMEYDYAVQSGVPVLGFVRNDIGSIPFENSEQSESGRTRLDAFRSKVMSRTCRKYSTAGELGMAVLKSLAAESRVRPRTGWVRADQARSEEDLQRERDLLQDLKEAQETIQELERELRDRAVLVGELRPEELSQGADIFDIAVTYSNSSKQVVSEIVGLAWDDIFRVIGPSLYGYILRKAPSYGRGEIYRFHDSLEQHIRAKIVGKVQNRKINIKESDIDTIVIQFKELGLIQFSETEGEKGDVFRGITLTASGERYLARLSIKKRAP